MWSTMRRETLTVVLIRATGEIDTDGVAVTTTETREWSGCSVQPLATTEDTTRSERITESLAVSGDLATWITGGDKIVRCGVAYRVEGKPSHRQMVMPHTELVLLTWTGA